MPFHIDAMAPTVAVRELCFNRFYRSRDFIESPNLQQIDGVNFAPYSSTKAIVGRVSAR